jgi:hypothetical protein
MNQMVSDHKDVVDEFKESEKGMTRRSVHGRKVNYRHLNIIS